MKPEPSPPPLRPPRLDPPGDPESMHVPAGDDPRVNPASGKWRSHLRAAPGSSPGIESMIGLEQAPEPGSVRIQCVDYSPERIETREFSDVDEFLRQRRPEWSKVRWLNVDGLHPQVVNRLREHFGFHTLAAEDVLRVSQRPKLETFDGCLFVVVRMIMLRDERLSQEQVSLFLFSDALVTFQETPGDVWDPIRSRLANAVSRLRTNDASYLLYALLDAVVDHCFPVLEHVGDELERLEDEIIARATPALQRRVHEAKRELAGIRRLVWPLREVVNSLHRPECGDISDYVRTYMRDVYDHTVQVMDIVESYREMAASLQDLYMSAVGNRMNEIMKVLTIMASFFIPITFIAGVYGMNFDVQPEVHWRFGYAFFWVACLAMTAALAIYFVRKGWIGRR